MRRGAVAWVLAVFLPAAALAQDTPHTAQSGSRPLIRPEATYVFNHLPNSDLVFEAQIAPRIIIMDSIGRATTRLLGPDRPALWGWQLSTTPMVRLRMFDETSNPVRTPSYMPKATLQFARLQNLTRLRDHNEPEFNEGPIGMWLVEVVPFGHHSNGQNGCLFESQTRDPVTGECDESDPTKHGIIKKRDGSFSTNYFEATVHYGRLGLDSEGAPEIEYATRWEWRIGGGVQLNPKGFVGGSIDDELADIYGQTRIILDATVARRDFWRCGRAEGDARIQFFTDAPAGIPTTITRVEASCLPRGWGGAGIFIRVHHGQDYYNLGFAESITRFQFGITLQQDSFLSFKIRS
jgi:hypothetical protein